MTELVVTRGLPGSGKTTWAKLQGDLIRVNRDDLRDMLFDQYTGLTYQQEEMVTEASEALVTGHLKAGRSVVVDDCNLRPKYVRKWRKIAKACGAEFVIHEMPLDLDLAQQRNAFRATKGGRYVDPQVITDMFDAYTKKGQYLPIPDEQEDDVQPEEYIPPHDCPYAFIFDIDGTLAHMTDRSPYDYSRVSEDEGDEAVADMAAILSERFDIVIVSGRPDSCREATKNWLRNHDIPFNAIFMRTAGDKRRDSIIKREIFDREIRNNWHVMGVFDDRDQVVDMWRGLGLKCYQVERGAF